MGADKEIVVALRDIKLDCEYGSYLRMEEVEAEVPEVIDEWNHWLETQRDPGHYDAYKVIREGKIEWVCDTFMPGFLCRKLRELLDRKTEI